MKPPIITKKTDIWLKQPPFCPDPFILSGVEGLRAYPNNRLVMRPSEKAEAM